jgi:hypothetical protein
VKGRPAVLMPRMALGTGGYGGSCYRTIESQASVALPHLFRCLYATLSAPTSKPHLNCHLPSYSPPYSLPPLPPSPLSLLPADNATAEDAVGKAFASGILHVHAAFDYFNLPGVGAGIAAGIGKGQGRSREDLFITAMTSPCVHPAAPPQRNVTDPAACTALTSLEVTV